MLEPSLSHFTGRHDHVNIQFTMCYFQLVAYWNRASSLYLQLFSRYPAQHACRTGDFIFCPMQCIVLDKQKYTVTTLPNFYPIRPTSLADFEWQIMVTGHVECKDNWCWFGWLVYGELKKTGKWDALWKCRNTSKVLDCLKSMLNAQDVDQSTMTINGETS